MKTRKCKKCCKTLPHSVNYFQKTGQYNSNGEPYIRSMCKNCFSKYSTEQTNNYRRDNRKKLNAYIKNNGKFDFVICRQTLEDLGHPEFVVNQVQKVANAGWIGVPSKYFEMTRGLYPEMPNSRGLHHHRWIYTSKNGRWYGLPKMGWTDSISDSSLSMKLNGNPWAHELSFYWEKNIDVFWLLPYCDNLPDDYGDEFVRDCLRGVKHPWDLWINILNNSD